jgi:glycogen(starch) synthase
MRILVLSNFYPPHYIGGYELGCLAVVEGLAARGHEVSVLTSTYGVGSRRTEGSVYRWLDLDDGAPAPASLPRRAAALLKREVRNQRAFERAVRRARPDLVYVWNMAQLPISLAARAERTGLPVCYFISDRWLTRWAGDGWHQLWSARFRRPAWRAARRAAAAALSLPGVVTQSALALPYAHFVSDYLRRDAALAGQVPRRSEVIHWGVAVEKFSYRRDADASRARLLYVGQVTAMKGFRTAVEAMRLLVEARAGSPPKLTVAGGSITPDFFGEMRDLVRAYGLDAHVEFVGFVAHESLPAVYAAHDVLIFPSLFEEALTITTLEAMACGVAVVSTATGGNPEVLRHEFNALTFEKEDASACAAHVGRLMDDPALFGRLRSNARRTVEDGFEIGKMIAALERSLRDQIESRRQQTTGARGVA